VHRFLEHMARRAAIQRLLKSFMAVEVEAGRDAGHPTLKVIN